LRIEESFPDGTQSFYNVLKAHEKEVRGGL